MIESTTLHPDAVLATLLTKALRTRRQRTLRAVHEICRRQHQAGKRDFSLATIGKFCEADRILNHRSIYNDGSMDYRSLTETWAAYAGPPSPPSPKELASAEYLMRIPDPAIRSIMQTIVAERDKLRAQINTLKAHAQVVIDRRPSSSIAGSALAPTTALSMVSRLTKAERTALQQAITPEFLQSEGWHESEHGQITNDRGRTIYRLGYVTAMRKVLGL